MSRKKFHKRESLIDVAMKEFQKYGYDDASLNQIIQDTDIAKMTFYYHYNSKEELFFSLFDEITLKFEDFKDDYLKKHPRYMENVNILELLKTYSEILIRFIEKNPLYCKFWTSSYLTDNLYIRQKVKEKLIGIIEPPLKKMFDNAFDRKEIRQDIDKDFLFKYFFINLLFTIREIICTVNSCEVNVKKINNIVDDSFKIFEGLLIIEDESYLCSS
ncbi:MAG TPA: TetR/AcrR family transcriptional regulator [Tissierellales bacterium]|nr:TetR/AcrR family transcriptional regulator [Tissierellales bacterium]